MTDQRPASQQRSTLILDSNFSYQLFASYMKNAGWTIRNRRETGQDGERSIDEVWGKQGVPVAVHYLDDQNLWTKALWIRGSEIQPVLAELSPRFGGPPPQELFERLDEAETIHERVVAIVQLAVGFADAFDPDVLEVLAHYANDESAQVRGATIQALLYTQWPEGMPILTTLADEDPESSIREYAANVLTHLSGPRALR